MRLENDSTGWGCDAFRIAFAVALGIFILGLCSGCKADCVGGDGNRETAVNESGLDGWWVSRSFLGCLLDSYEADGKQQEQVKDLEFVVKTQKETLGNYRAHVELERRATERAHDALDIVRDEAESSGAWYNAPVLWFAIGVAVTGASVVAISGASK